MDGITAERYKELYGTKPEKYLKENRESIEQQHLFTWAGYMSGQYPCLDLMYHIPNEGKRSEVTGGILKAEGLKAGVPDICLPVASNGYHGLYIEMKAKGGSTTKLQKQWIAALNAQNYFAVVCFGFDEAKAIIEKYLNMSR